MNADTFSLYGYISPDGSWYSLKGTYEHEEFARKTFPNLSNPSRHMDDTGWIRLSGPSQIMPGFPHLHCKCVMTQAQQDSLFEWCELAGEDYNELLMEFGLQT